MSTILEEPLVIDNLEFELSYYSKNQKIQYHCVSCGKIRIVRIRYWCGKLLCTSCLKKANLVKKYGSIENFYKQRQEKYRKTSLEKYGVENAGNSKLAREKAKQTCLKKYGAECVFASEKIKQKIKKIVQQKYDVEHISKLKSTQDKREATYLKRYGFKSTFNNTEKIQKIILEKYGVDNASKSEKVKQKKQETCLKHFGVDSSLKAENVKNKIKETMLQRYGVEHALQNKELFRKTKAKYFYENESFDSSWELAVWIWAKDNNLKIEHEPIPIKYSANNKEHLYFPDFRIDDRLIEIKGDQFFDIDGKMSNPFNSSDEIKNLYQEKQKAMQDNHVEIWKENELKPILKYISEKYGPNYLKSFRRIKNER